jgi:hypothetical protein
VSLDPLVGVVRDELRQRELAVIVCAQHPELAPVLVLYGRPDMLDGICRSSVGVEDDRPYVPRDIVDK